MQTMAARPASRVSQQIATALIVALPTAALVAAVIRLWGHGIGARDVIIAAAFYFLIGHAVAIGYHRLLAHRSFRARRPLKVALAVAASLAFQGGPIGWVADHRRHHAYTDRDGDPHSPHTSGPGLGGQLRGLWHAHTGWLFSHAPTNVSKYATDLIRDHDLVVIDRLFPLFCVATLALPFGMGWALGGSLGAGATTLLWAGLVRVFLLHHVTWSVNSICHTFGRRPFRSNDESRNVAALALVSFGESWHNGHHAFPTSARLGVDRGQIDTSAWLISAFQRFGWVDRVRGIDADRRAAKRVARAGT